MTANGRTDVMEIVGVLGIQSSAGKGGGGGARGVMTGLESRQGRQGGCHRKRVTPQGRGCPSHCNEGMATVVWQQKATGAAMRE
jgi:hypothetical protein